ncbi:hypothetical protein [Flavobacterium sp.]|uniref:hypothetical protein n=1 Tax=Flavobacterium sp. TaxID=239 RepID=UPI00121E4661|nr:hypothetical protein [Flavobacterium sp.]RZJ70287.1 MAG: hypothetical protein EOO49_14245 [Flavobacterium sp.]
MAKVFRFHQGNDSIEDWQTSTAYGTRAIEAIQDPAGATARREITSIPSPFARIDLVKSAFENLVNSGQIEGSTIFHKMVSDCLDVGQILFNIDKHRDKVDILIWDKTKDLDALLESANPKHRLLGETLKLYLRQDASAYNFDGTERLFLLNYKGGPNPMNILGGTSPASLFFTSANDLSYVDILFGNDRVFDKSYQPLHKREFNYIKFIYGLKKFFPRFSSVFKAVDAYIDLNFVQLRNEEKEILKNYTKNDFDLEFERLSAGGDGSIVEVLGFPLRKKTEGGSVESGFAIASGKYDGKDLPLVLPVDDFSEKTKYTSDFWNRNNKADYADNRPIKERTLPFDGTKYPYLTISDFLEPYIIRTVYPIQSSKFFDGNLTVGSGEITKGFLLPIKTAYFDYFDVKDLQGVTSDGKKVFELRQMTSGGISATLRIPIQSGGYITYERMYYPSTNEYQIAEPEISRNRGAIIENQFGLTVYPFLKLAEDQQNQYRVAFVDRDIQEHTKHSRFTLGFYKNQANSPVTEKAVKSRNNKENDYISSDYYVLEDSFDYVTVKNNWGQGIVVPKFQMQPSGTAQFTFAVDFGTTNTHIEYRKDKGTAKPFEISEDDIQIATLHDIKNPETLKSIGIVRANRLLELIPQELIPEMVNAKSEFQFPLRTAILSNEKLDMNHQTYALADLNIPFVYEKYPIPTNSKTRTNLKWADYTNKPNEIKIIEAYFENLLFLIRNKVILNGGDLTKVRLIWLYPSSMTKHRINMLESTWNRLFAKFINTTQAPDKLSESIAPFYYFNSQLGVNALSSSVVSIDIGGGTTDVVVYTNNRPEILTSFRFAANAIFGDAFGRSSVINGFIQKYVDRIRFLLETNKQHDLIKILDEIKENGKSEDIVAFFFSIEKNKKIKDNNIPISFSKKLMLNSDFKIVFLLFYTAIIYHVAKMIKARSVSMPRYITFSGTGSKIINVADGSDRLSALTELTQIVFRQIFNTDEMSRIELIQDENPKEISCKGALNIPQGQSINVDAIKAVLLGTTQEIVIPEKAVTYRDIDREMETSVQTEYTAFLDWFFSLNKSYSFKDNFGINPVHLQTYKAYLTENALDDLKAGIEDKQKDLDNDLDVNLEETLFFYPLVGGLNHLAYKIQSELNTQEI